MEYYVTKQNLAEKTDQWLEKISSYNTHKMKPDIENSCLMVIDMQNFFLDPDSPTFVPGGLAVKHNIKKFIDAFRSAGRPVIYTQHAHHGNKIDAGIMEWWWEGMCIEGSPESEVIDELKPLSGEKQIIKHRYSSFYNTDLETVLRVQGIKDIVITGIMTNMCCESTARGAYYRDYRVFFPADATGSVTEEMHLGSLLNLGFGFAYICKTGEILSYYSKK